MIFFIIVDDFQNSFGTVMRVKNCAQLRIYLGFVKKLRQFFDGNFLWICSTTKNKYRSLLKYWKDFGIGTVKVNQKWQFSGLKTSYPEVLLTGLLQFEYLLKTISFTNSEWSPLAARWWVQIKPIISNPKTAISGLL